MRITLIAFGWLGVLATISHATSTSAQVKNQVFYGVQFEELEYRQGDENEKLLAWSGDAFFGSDEIKLRWLSEGEYDREAKVFEDLENRLVLQTPISEFFDAKVGVRLNTPEGTDRWYGVFGLTGLAPQWFEVDVDFFVSENGDLSARLDTEYELLLTNRLILTPSLDFNVAFSDDQAVGIGSGISNVGVGLRLSYDLVDRAISPYAGIAYEQKFGDTASFAREDGEDIEGWRVVIGTKLRF